ncbi:hypothetical protein [Cohnella sp. GCM10012308]|uniref:hypothetical protein n=1 Tax=Cohnella sp. GCM10012308 TaxID=3317329 RepID=UPI00360E0628
MRSMHWIARFRATLLLTMFAQFRFRLPTLLHNASLFIAFLLYWALLIVGYLLFAQLLVELARLRPSLLL